MNEADNQQENKQIDLTSDNKNKLVIPPRTSIETLPYEGNQIKEKVLAVLGALAVTGLVIMGTTVSWGQTKPETEYVAVIPKIQENVPKPPETPNPFYNVSLQAKAAIVYDVQEDKVVYGFNEKKVLPLASLTKLMTALLAVETLEQEKNVAIPLYALETEGDSGLLLNESWRVRDLVSFTMLTSSNDGADALAVAVGSLLNSTPEVLPEYESVETFVEKMNYRAKEIGMENTRYMNATGLDVPNGGGMGTAEDMSKLLKYIWEHEPSAISYTNEYTKTFISEDGFMHAAENTNNFVYDIPGLLGSKTGYTQLAGGNLAIMYDEGLGHPMIVVVLGSTREGRFSDVKTLVDAAYEYSTSGWAEYDRVAGTTVTSIE